jgi:hypothetical protein
MPPSCRRRRHPHDPADARPCRHQADAAVPEHHGRGTQARDDWRLGAQTPAAARGWLGSTGACRRESCRRVAHAESTMAGHIEPRRIVSQLSVVPDLALPEGRFEMSRKRIGWPANRSTDKGLWEVRRLARPAGLEPATPGLEGRCSIHLSYGRTRTGMVQHGRATLVSLYARTGRPRLLHSPLCRPLAHGRLTLARRRLTG